MTPDDRYEQFLKSIISAAVTMRALAGAIKEAEAAFKQYDFARRHWKPERP